MKEAIGADVTNRIEDGVLTMEVDETATIYLNTPRNTPLTVDEQHVTLKVSGTQFTAEIELDGEQLDGLADALYYAQKEHNGE